MKKFMLFHGTVALVTIMSIAGVVGAVSAYRDFVEGQMIPSTLKGDYTIQGDLTTTGTTTIAGVNICTDVQTFAGEVHLNGSITELGNAAADAITVTGTMTAAELAKFTTGITFGADPADAGAIRLSNAQYILAEADAAGIDISVIGVDSGELIQIGASGSSGVVITPATTVTGAATFSGAVHLNGTILNVGATGVNITSDNDGAITFLGQSAGNDESLTFNFDDGAANSVTVSTASAVDTIDWSAIGHTTTGTVKTGILSVGGHVITRGTVPTASAGTIDTKSTDHAGRIASVGATSTIITFASAYTATPACVATASDEPVWIVGASTTGFTPTATGNIDDLNYVCFEIE